MEMILKYRDPLKSRIFYNTCRILKKNNIPFWLDSGTLLGIVREGKSLEWHKNIDIAVPGDYYNNVINLEKKFFPKYRFRKMIDRSGRIWIDNDFPKLKILKAWSKHRNSGTKIKVTFKYKKENKYIWVDKRSCKWVNSNYFDKLDILEAMNMKYPIPSNSKQYLQERYGDWENEEKYWISSIHDKSIVDDKIINNVPIKKRIRKSKTKKIELTGRYRNRMKKAILRVITILEKNNIPYWMDEGTLLGIIRDGDLLPWDHDADLGIPGDFAEKVWKIRYKFFPHFFVKRNMTSNKWLPGRFRSIKLKTPLERLLRINFHIDLFCKYKINDKYHWIIMNALKHSESKFFDKLDTIMWENRKVNIPSNVKEYLSINYGNWEVPDPDFDPSIDNGTIAERGF